MFSPPPDPGPSAPPGDAPWTAARGALDDSDDGFRSRSTYGSDYPGATPQARSTDPFDSSGWRTARHESPIEPDPSPITGYEPPTPYDAPPPRPTGGRRRRSVEPTADQAFLDLPPAPPSHDQSDSGGLDGRALPSHDVGHDQVDGSSSLFDYPDASDFPAHHSYQDPADASAHSGQPTSYRDDDRSQDLGDYPAFDDLSAPLGDPLTGPLPDHGWGRTSTGGNPLSDILPESTAASEVTTGFHALRETDRGDRHDGSSVGHPHDPDYLRDLQAERGGRRSHRREDPDPRVEDLGGPNTEPMVMPAGPAEHDRPTGHGGYAGYDGRTTPAGYGGPASPATTVGETRTASPAAAGPDNAAADPRDYPDDLRPRRRHPGRDLTAAALGRPMSSPMAGLGADLSAGPAGPIAVSDFGSEPESGRRGLGARFTGGRSTSTSTSATRSSTQPATRSARAKRSGHRVRRTRPAGLPAPVAIVVAIVGGLGSAFLDLQVTGMLGVLFSLGFVLTSFGVAAGIRRSDIFTAGVLPPLAALATFAGVGVASPEQLGGTSSPVVAVLTGLATESWTLVAASSLTLGTIALRVAVGRSRLPELSAEERFEGPAAAPVAMRRSGSRPPF